MNVSGMLIWPWLHSPYFLSECLVSTNVNTELCNSSQCSTDRNLQSKLNSCNHILTACDDCCILVSRTGQQVLMRWILPGSTFIVDLVIPPAPVEEVRHCASCVGMIVCIAPCQSLRCTVSLFGGKQWTWWPKNYNIPKVYEVERWGRPIFDMSYQTYRYQTFL